MACNRMNKKGQVLILVALTLVLVLALGGLAVDVGVAYVVKTKLSSAVDAAALAAGRVVSQASAREAEAQKFFYANFPQGLLGATVDPPVTTADYDPSEKSWTVTVRATAQVPTYFARVMNWERFTVGASATSTVDPVDLVLVLDASSSLRPPTSEEGTLDSLKAAATRFLTAFDEQNDRVGLVHFASGAVEDVRITSATGYSRQRLDRVINGDHGIGGIGGIQCSGYTTAEEALRLAKKQLDDVPVDLRSRRRIIVFFTDGAPNGVAANYSTGSGTVTGALTSEEGTRGRLYRVSSQNSDLGVFSGIATLPERDWTGTVSLAGRRTFDPRATESGIPYTDCNLNRAARNMVENIAEAARSESGAGVTPITIFTIGLGARMNTLEVEEEEGACGYGVEEHGTNILRRLANVPTSDTYNRSQPTGFFAFAGNKSELDAAFYEVTKAILRLSR